MAIATTQQISRYYETYKDIDVVFSKEVTSVTHLQTRQIFIKGLGAEWPCILNSTSFTGAKVIIGVKSNFLQKINSNPGNLSLRFAFQMPDRTEPVAFFVSCKVATITPYAGSQDLVIVSLTYTQRPPDDLIEIMGKLLDANVNSARRKEERIIINPDSTRRLNLSQKETIMFIQGVPRRCILRDLSFSGAKVIIVGIPQFLKDKEISLRLDFDDPREVVSLRGIIARTEEIEGRKDLVAVAIVFDEQSIPMSYKMHINAYLTQYRKQELSAIPNPAKPAAEPAAM